MEHLWWNKCCLCKSWAFCSSVPGNSVLLWYDTIMGLWDPVTPDCRMVFPSFVLVWLRWPMQFEILCCSQVSSTNETNTVCRESVFWNYSIKFWLLKKRDVQSRWRVILAQSCLFPIQISLITKDFRGSIN